MEEKYVFWKGKRLCYQVKKGEKGPVVFLHGATSSLSALKWLALPFKREKFTLVFPDLGGHGRSFRTRDYQDLLIENHVHQVKKILEREGFKKVFLVGHCLGAMVAATFAALEKEKVLKLVLISPGTMTTRASFLYSPLFKKLIEVLAKTAFSFGIFKKRVDYQPYLNTGDFYLPRIAADIFHTSLPSVLAQLRAVLEWKGEKYFKRIKVPTLIISGKKDKIFPPSFALQIKSLIKGARLCLLEKANHVPVLNMPERIASLVICFIKEK